MYIRRRIKRFLILFLLMGIFYYFIEGVFRAISMLVEYSNFSLKANVSLWMFFVGGLCGVLLGFFNIGNHWLARRKIFTKSIIGTLIVILPLEYSSGIVLNRMFNFAIWDYSHLPLNLDGQICFLFSILWILLCPLVFWVADLLRWAFYREKREIPKLIDYLWFLRIKTR